MGIKDRVDVASSLPLTLTIAAGLFLLGCTTLPSCAWGKCAYPRTPALAPQTSERVYPLPYEETYAAVRLHFNRRGYPFERTDADIIETKPYAEKEFAKFLGLQYHWRVQVRKMDTLNTAVTPRLYVHETNKPPRELTPGLWPEPYRFFYHEIERSLFESTTRG
jgi:hypothetical protein